MWFCYLARVDMLEVDLHKDIQDTRFPLKLQLRDEANKNGGSV